MACDFLNKSLNQAENITSGTRNWTDQCCKGLEEYTSDEELADVQLFSNCPIELLIFSAACISIFMIIGIPGNIVTIVALSRYRKVRNATAIFIINLSVSDLLFACLIFPITISTLLNHSWKIGKFMCRFYPAANYCLTASSVFSIVAITINRYVMVSHPLHYPKLYQTRNLIIMILFIWLGAFSMIMPTIFEIWGQFSLDPSVGFCTIIPDKNKNTPKKSIIVMGFVFPCFCIVACYTRIMCVVKKSTAKSRRPPTISNITSDLTSRIKEMSSKELTSTENSEEGSDDRETSSGGNFAKFTKNIKNTLSRRPRRESLVPTRRDKRLQSMIIAIIISFFSTNLPIMVAKLVSEDFEGSHYGNMLGYIFMYMSVCSNPIIYVVMSKEYRQAYKKVFGFMCTDNPIWRKKW